MHKQAKNWSGVQYPLKFLKNAPRWKTRSFSIVFILCFHSENYTVVSLIINQTWWTTYCWTCSRYSIWSWFITSILFCLQTSKAVNVFLLLLSVKNSYSLVVNEFHALWTIFPLFWSLILCYLIMTTHLFFRFHKWLCILNHFPLLYDPIQ